MRRGWGFRPEISHADLFRPDAWGLPCDSIGFSLPSLRFPFSLRRSTHNAAGGTCAATRDAMDRTSHRTPDRPRTAAATPHRHQDHAATPPREDVACQALDPIARHPLVRTRARRRTVEDGFPAPGKQEINSCGAAGIPTVGGAMWSTTLSRSARVERIRRATCSGRPSRRRR